MSMAFSGPNIETLEQLITYTITRLHGCITIAGTIPISDLCALGGVWNQRQGNTPVPPSELWACDSLLADRLGLNLVCGALRDRQAWRAKLGIGEKNI